MMIQHDQDERHDLKRQDNNMIQHDQDERHDLKDKITT